MNPLTLFIKIITILILLFDLAACRSPSVDSGQNLKEAEQFLNENRQKPGIVTTPSGLQYQILKVGAGASPTPTSIVTVNYQGSLINGVSFDSGKEISFPLNQVIPGWTEGLQLMRPGAQYRFFIPSNLAYGEQGAGGTIPGNAALIFDVELLKIEP